MAERREYMGATYERAGPGQPWSLVASGQSQPMTIGTPDPSVPLDMQIKQGQIAAQERTAATAPFDARTAAANAAKAEADAKIAGQKAAESSVSDPLSVLAQRRLGQDELLSVLNDARREIASGVLPSAGFGSSIGRMFGGTSATDLAGSLNTIGSKTVLEKLGELKSQSATGASGLGALSEKEAAYLRDSIASLDQSQSKDKLLSSLARIELHYRRLNALADGKDPDKKDVAQAYGIAVDAPKGGGGAPPPSGGLRNAPGVTGPGGTPTGGGKTVRDPALAGVNSRVAAMIKGGASGPQIRDYLEGVQPGLGQSAQNIEAWVQYHNQNPNKPVSVKLDEVFVPSSGIARALGDAATGTIGGVSPGAYAIGAADMLTGGNLDSLTGDPGMARAAMAGISEQNPGSSLAGQVMGGALAAGGVEAGLGRLGMGPARALAGDALFGGIYGAGSNDQNRLGGALVGSLAGAGGGALGRRAATAIGGAATGVTDAGRQLLNRAGVRMTPGQIMGGGAKAWEDRLAGFPIVGDAINARRREGVQDFNRAAFDEALAPIGQTTGGTIAEPGIDLARQMRSDEYSRVLDPVRVQADAPFVADMQAAVQAGQALPEPMRSGMEYTLPTRVGQSFDNAGQMTGRDYQQSLRGLRRDVRSQENLPYGYDFGQVAGQAENALEGMLQRQAPGTVEGLRTANRVNMNVETLRDAVNRARNGTRSGQVGEFMPSQLADAAAQTAKRFGNNQGTTQQPFFDLTRAGQQALPSQIPDSGTAGRYVIPALAGAAGGTGGAFGSDGSASDRAQSGLGYGLGAAALASAPYSQASRAALQRALLAERPDIIVNLGNMIRDRARIGGMFGAPVGVGAANNYLLGGQ